VLVGRSRPKSSHAQHKRACHDYLKLRAGGRNHGVWAACSTHVLSAVEPTSWIRRRRSCQAVRVRELRHVDVAESLRPGEVLTASCSSTIDQTSCLNAAGSHALSRTGMSTPNVEGSARKLVCRKQMTPG